jgi:hypothetical protein
VRFHTVSDAGDPAPDGEGLSSRKSR